MKRLSPWIWPAIFTAIICAFYFHYERQSDRCRNTRCHEGEYAQLLITSYRTFCACVPGGWDQDRAALRPEP